MKTVVVPGTFDPVTLGHFDVIRKASELFDKVIVLVSVNFEKTPLFDEFERAKFIEDGIKQFDLKNVTVQVDRGLVAQTAKDLGAQAIVKGLRHSADYENELAMALMNRHLTGVETLLIPSDSHHSQIASSFIKNVASHGGNVSDMVTELVNQRLKEVYAK